MADDERGDGKAPESAEVALWRLWIDKGRQILKAPLAERAQVARFVRGGLGQWNSVSQDAWAGHRVVANYCYPTTKVFLPHLVPRHPRAVILPRTASRVVGPGEAAVLEEKLAYDWREGFYLREIRKAATEALMGGVGWVRVAWDRERGIPEVRHRKPDRVVVDPEVEEELCEAGWVAERVTMRVADIKADPFFKGADRLDAKSFRSSYGAGGADGGAMGAAGPDTTGLDRELLSILDVWFIWSRRGKGDPRAKEEGGQEEPLGENRLLCFAEGHDFWLHDGPWPMKFDHDEFPFRLLRFNYDPERFHSFGPLKPAVAIQRFLNWQLSFLLSHTKKGAVAKIVYDKGQINEEQLARIFNGKDYEAVAVDFLDGKKPFEVIDLQTDPTKIEGSINLALKVMFDITGAAELVMGGQGKTQSATEAGIREQRVQNRIDDMRDQVKDFVIDVNRAVAMVDILKTPPRTKGGARGIDFFLGDAAIAPWERLHGMDIRTLRAEVAFEIDAGTMRRPTREEQLQDIFGLWDRLAPVYLQLGRFDLLQSLIARLIKALEIENPQELVPAQLGPAGPTPELQQAQQLQAQQAQQIEQMDAQQREAQLQAAFQQVNQQIEMVRGVAEAGQMAARQELQSALLGFQTALQSLPPPAPGAQITSQGPLALTTQNAQLGAEQVNAQIGQMTTSTAAVEVGADEIIVPPPVAEPVPTVTEQVVERDALGRIARIVSRSEPVQQVAVVEEGV